MNSNLRSSPCSGKMEANTVTGAVRDACLLLWLQLKASTHDSSDRSTKKTYEELPADLQHLLSLCTTEVIVVNEAVRIPADTS